MKEEKMQGATERTVVMDEAETAAQNNGFADAKRLMANRFGTVETEVGKFRIRRLDHAEATELDGSVADLSSMAAEPKDAELRKGRRLPADFSRRVPAIHRLVRAAVVTPELFEKPEEGLTPNDIPFPVLMQLYTEIMGLAGAALSVAKRIRPS